MIVTITLNPSIDRLYHVKKLIPGQLNRVHLAKRMVGGKGINAGRVSSILGCQTLVSALIGGDNGQFIAEESKHDLYSTCFIDTKLETRNCLQIIDDLSNKTEINEEGAAVEQYYYSLLYEHLKGILLKNDVKAMSINGSIPQGSDYRYYIKLIQLVRQLRPSCQIILDTSGTILSQILEENVIPDVIKPNEHEIADYLQIPVTKNINKLATAILASPKLSKIPKVFVSLGSKGCLIKDNFHFYQATLPAIGAINTEGSGDSMVGGILAAIDKGLSDEQITKYAVAAGTANAMNLKTGFIELPVFHSLLSKVAITQIQL